MALSLFTLLSTQSLILADSALELDQAAAGRLCWAWLARGSWLDGGLLALKLAQNFAPLTAKRVRAGRSLVQR